MKSAIFIKHGGVWFFVLFTVVVVGAYLFYQPSWGVMDDHQFLTNVHAVWSSPHFFSAAGDFFKDDFMGQKMRPLYSLYALFLYQVFAHHPTAAYIFIFVILIAVFPLWGRMLSRMFGEKGNVPQDAHFIFPLAFFLFTPFWNNFMYISLQEKLLFLFSTFSLRFLMSSYDRPNPRDMGLTLVFAILCLLSKPTGVFIFLAIMALGGLDILLFRKQWKVSAIHIFSGLWIIGFYYLLVKFVLNSEGYSSRYVENFSFSGIMTNIAQASIIIRLLCGLSVILFLVNAVFVYRGVFHIASLMLPLGFLTYTLVLAPWGLTNYLLAPVGPYAVGMIYPVYRVSGDLLSRTKLKSLPVVVVLLLSTAVLTQIIVPRISKMADIRKVIAQIDALDVVNAERPFYFPPPFIETRQAISHFSGATIGYLSQGVLKEDDLGRRGAYLIVRDECTDIDLKGVVLSEIVYQNDTWKIFVVLPASGHEETTRFTFPGTLFQKVVEKIRNRS